MPECFLTISFRGEKRKPFYYTELPPKSVDKIVAAMDMGTAEIAAVYRAECDDVEWLWLTHKFDEIEELIAPNSTRMGGATYKKAHRQAAVMETELKSPSLRRRGAASRRDYPSEVRDYIQSKIAGGANIRDITRDGIATALQMPASTVSGTSAWKALNAEKRQQRAAETNEGAVLKALKRGDTKAALAIQREEERRQR